MGGHIYDMRCTSFVWHWLDHFSPCQHKWVQKPLLSPCRGTISRSVGSFQSSGGFAGWRTLTIESSLMSGCSYGHEPTENVTMKYWLKFPVLAPRRSGNTDQRRYPQPKKTSSKQPTELSVGKEPKLGVESLEIAGKLNLKLALSLCQTLHSMSGVS